METQEIRRLQRLPNNWEVPQELRNRFGSKAGRQRAHELKGHVVILLHHPPKTRAVRRNAVYFWRHNLGEWSCSEGRHGVETIAEHVRKYEKLAESLENQVARAKTTSDWFEVLAVAAPLRRATRNMSDALHAAEQWLPVGAESELREASDAAAEVVRDIELLQEQAQQSVDFLIARQSEIQALAGEAHVDAAYRLNVIAALFLPLATIASVFGMNVPSGMERSSTLFFWTIVVVGVGLGVGVVANVMRLKSWKPDEW